MIRRSDRPLVLSRQARCAPLAGCIASLLGLLPAAAQAHPPASSSAPSAAYSAARSLRLPLAGLLSVAAAPSNSGPVARRHRSRFPGSSPALRAGRALATIEDRGLLTSVPVNAFGFLSDAALAPSRPGLRPLTHEARQSDPSSNQPPTLAKPSAQARITRDVVLDNSLGQTQQPVVSTNSNGQNDYAIYGTMGLQVGSNLFYSFSSFNLATQESATFSGPFTVSTPVQNILARVSGGASSVDGLISTSKIPGSNLFLLNPSGVIFGPNAQLDVGSSFVVSTADYIKLADGARFDSRPGANDPGLSAAAVTSFGFVSRPTSSVELNGPQLAVPAGAGLDIIAGGITLTDGINSKGNRAGATLFAQSGAIAMFSAGSAGEVPFRLASPGAGFGQASATAGGPITLSNQSIAAINGNGGGELTIYGGAVTFDNSDLRSFNLGSGAGGPVTVVSTSLSIDGNAGGIFVASLGNGSAGNVSVAARGQITITAGGEISADALSSGRGGNISLTAGSLTIDGAASSTQLTGIFAQSSQGATGKGGDITVNVPGLLTISGGAEISSSTNGLGQGGNIQVTAGALTITGGLPDDSNYSGILSETNAGGAGGAAGDVTVKVAGLLTVAGGAAISSSTFGLGPGGNVQVTAGQLTIAGELPDGSSVSGIFAETDSTLEAGLAGNVSVNVSGLLTITGGAEISSSTYGPGHGGNVQLMAGRALISGATSDNTSTSGIFAETESGGFGGAAGNIAVDVPGQLIIAAGAQISSSTFGLGQGGSVQIKAGQLTVTGALPDNSGVSGIIAETSSDGAGGPGGDVSVTVAGLLTLAGGGEISSSTTSFGHGGNVNVTAKELTIGGVIPSNQRVGGIFAESVSFGPQAGAGDVRVKVGGLLTIFGGGQIASSTFGSANGGSVEVEAGQLIITGGTPNANSPSGIFASSAGGTGAAGDVSVTVPGVLTISHGGEISSSTAGLGQGGSVRVDAGQIFISGALPDEEGLSGIFAATASTGQGGPAGDIHVQAGELTLFGAGTISSSSASSGRAGAIDIIANQVTLSGQSSILTSALQSNAGSISIDAGSNLLLSGGSGIAASAAENGGNITITAGNLVYLLQSAIVATAGSLNGGRARGGAGGNITIDPKFIVLDDSIISANAAAGRGGNIILDTENYLSSGSLVTATGATAGTITITAPELDLTNGLVPLSGSLLQVSSQLRDLCAQRLGQEFSSFLVLGQGGVDSEPDEAQASAPDAEESRQKTSRAQAENACHSGGIQ